MQSGQYTICNIRGLTQWGQAKHMAPAIWAIIDWGNGLSPVRRQAITWTTSDSLSIGHRDQQTSLKVCVNTQ